MASADGIALALLAAGRSTRFGEADKLAALLGNLRLIDWAAQAGASIEVEHRFVVLGAGAILDPAPSGYQSLHNPHPEYGLSSSLRIAAHAAVQAGATALIAMLADMPFVDAEHLGRIVAAFRHDDTRPVFTRAVGGVAQPPALFPAAFFPTLQSLTGDKGARALAADATLIEIDAAHLLDIDTPADLDRARRWLAETSPDL